MVLQTAKMKDAPLIGGARLKRWREFRGLTQEQLAERCEPPTAGSVISNLENSDRGLSEKWLRKLAKVLGTKPGFLLDHDPEELSTDILEIWADVPEERKPLARDVLGRMADRTGTKG